MLLAVFFTFLLLTLGVSDLPVGRQFYGLFGVEWFRSGKKGGLFAFLE